ncbi:DUF4267 domain-containing protein [Spirosoma sp. KNUC1025]|uniref:DUF4267 domain-containing protein n=1 Tax=Spirosoma sp. KNUC1025 TaxID=2894082 RepID=UPI00386E53AB|nr:DUF4267 domain-containing protein [Spirosoma sp. KNUC1025]
MLTENLPIWAKGMGYLFAFGLFLIGGRFLLDPETAERGFGLIYAQPNESFHYIKAVRDLFSGLIILVFTVLNWKKPLAVAFLTGSLVPAGDMTIVLTSPSAVLSAAWIHGLTALAAWLTAYFLLRSKSQ